MAISPVRAQADHVVLGQLQLQLQPIGLQLRIQSLFLVQILCFTQFIAPYRQCRPLLRSELLKVIERSGEALLQKRCQNARVHRFATTSTRTFALSTAASAACSRCSLNPTAAALRRILAGWNGKLSLVRKRTL